MRQGGSLDLDHLLRPCRQCDKSSCVARQALAAAIENGDSIHELEFVGVSSKALGLLDDAGVVFLEQLTHLEESDILSIYSIGAESMNQLRQALCEFHLAAPIHAKREADLARRKAECDKLYRYGKYRNGQPDEDGTLVPCLLIERDEEDEFCDDE